MKMERDFHMANGEGETSYVNNSRHQLKALLETKPVLDKAVREVYMALLHPTMIVADLGCSSGQNTLLFTSSVIEAIGCHCDKFGHNILELQFFLNDLPGNDFNHVFRSLERFKESIAIDHKGEILPSFYIAGLPGSYYTKLFPRQSVHLFHSSYCLHWRSRLPDGLEGERKTYLNEGNIYIAKTTPSSIVKLYQEQFQEDMMLFLKLRYEELVFDGQMVLTFLGRKNEEIYNGSMSHLYGLLARSVQSLVEEGFVAKEKFDSFNLPFYGPSINEVKAVVKQSELFNISHIKLFESNWDPHDNSEGDSVHDSVQSGVDVAKSIRAVMEPILANHFGESILDKLFEKFTYNIAEHLEKEKTKYSVIVISLRKDDRHA